MISEFTPPGIKVVALRTGYGIEKGELYTVRGFVLNRHWKTREPDPHVLFDEIEHPIGHPHPVYGDEIGFPRDAFDIPSFQPGDQRLMELAPSEA